MRNERQLSTFDGETYLVFRAVERNIQDALAAMFLTKGIEIYWVDVDYEGRILHKPSLVEFPTTFYSACPPYFAIKTKA